MVVILCSTWQRNRLLNTLSAVPYPVVGKSFLVLAKCIREKLLDRWQDIYPCKEMQMTWSVYEIAYFFKSSMLSKSQVIVPGAAHSGTISGRHVVGAGDVQLQHSEPQLAVGVSGEVPHPVTAPTAAKHSSSGVNGYPPNPARPSTKHRSSGVNGYPPNPARPSTTQVTLYLQKTA